MASRPQQMIVTALAALLALCAPAAAQSDRATLVGQVKDNAGRPVAAAEIRLKGTDLAARTDDNGGFRLPSLPVGKFAFTARRLGFEPATFDLVLRAGNTDSLVLSMTASATNLPGVEVRDEYNDRVRRHLAGFWERRERGFGSYVTRADILARNPNDFVDILRNTPSVRVVNVNGRRTLRIGRYIGGGKGDCPPQYFVDNVRIEQGSPDEFIPEDVEGIEVYAGPATTPAQFAPRFNRLTCGAIVIWTRVP